MTRKSLFLLLCAAVLLIASPAYARPDSKRSMHTGTFELTPEKRRKIVLKLFEQLDLDENQEKLMKGLLEDHLEKNYGLKEAMAQREKLNALLRSSVASEEEIRAQAEATSQHFLKFHRQRLDRLLEIKKILRPEQFERLLSKMDSWKKRSTHKKRKD